MLLSELVHLADEHGFHATFARIAGENPASIALHSKHGFEMVGVEREVGRKFGQWLDVTVMQRLASGAKPYQFRNARGTVQNLGRAFPNASRPSTASSVP